MNLDTLVILTAFATVFGVAATIPNHEEPGFVYKAALPTRLIFLACFVAVSIAICRS